jgi:hypothetical protein
VVDGEVREVEEVVRHEACSGARRRRLELSRVEPGRAGLFDLGQWGEGFLRREKTMP